MELSQQQSLLAELLSLKQTGSFFLDDQPTTNPVRDYTDPMRFKQEQERIFGRLPGIVAHSSELPEPNTFVRRTWNGLPLILMRDDAAQARVFLNVCRHRGTRLVDQDQGCRKRFSCPYHAWTWNNRGEFMGGPHFEAGFPGLDKGSLGLKAVPCEERHGFIWGLPESPRTDLGTFLAELDHELLWTGTHGLMVHQTTQQLRRCNWKLLPEGGLEAYHFRVAHRNTIARLFNDNLSSYERLGPHLRSILPRASLVELAEQDPIDWSLREHANVLYTVFPANMLLVQMDHVIWINMEPVAQDETTVRMTTLKPRDSAEPDSYWDKNHGLTVETLNEDFDLAESMQSGMDSGANEALNFGRFEGALHRFNETIREHLNSAPPD